jgi:antitoxin (DNA-binding transcriptional repressor) of toxin-antitoxin stability system
MRMSEPVWGVSSRELYRTAAALLDAVESSGRSIIISRHGKAVAMLGPLPDEIETGKVVRFHASPRYEDYAGADTQPLDEGDAHEEFEPLDERQRGALAAVAADAPERWMPRSHDEVKAWLAPLYHLECAGLVDKVFGGWKITARGLRATAANPL